jgi:predicted DCC family thiol-disulfide oxidoreductase YuxK
MVYACFLSDFPKGFSLHRNKFGIVELSNQQEEAAALENDDTSTNPSTQPSVTSARLSTVIPPDTSIILFDGVCNLCNGAVQFIIRRDPRGHFKFAAQQSDTGKAILQQFHIKAGEAETIILIEGGQHFTQSTAALRISKRLRGLWPLVYAAILVPPFLRNAIYDYIARNRYRWFGRKDQCMIPTPEMKKRFLD